MNAFMIFGIIGLLTVVIAMLMAGGLLQLDKAVATNYASIESDKKTFDTKKTAGHKIQVNESTAVQQTDAMDAAAKRAAMMPRGANMGIGRLGQKSKLRTASDGVQEDAITAQRIATQQGWQGVGTGRELAKAGVAPVAAAAAASTGPMVKRKLVAGKDFAWTETKGMPSGLAKRQAIIANAKAKSAAYKAMKASGQDMVAAAGAPAAAAAPVAAAPVAQASTVPEPTLIEITEGMDKTEMRKAKISNAKAKSAYKKALKAAGETAPVAAAAAPVAAPPPPVAAAPAAAAAPSTTGLTAEAAGIAPPVFIEITDGMEASEIRAAKIANAKTKSAYNKQLKAAGIDPSKDNI